MHYVYQTKGRKKVCLHLLAVALCFCLLLAAGPICSIFVTAQETGFAGEGTESNPYRIENLEDLELLAGNVNGDGETEGINYSGMYFKLTADIDMSGKYGAGKGSWTPIGVGGAAFFAGIFDGGGHKISNLYINDDEAFVVGLFGMSMGEIKNLTVSGSVTGNNAESGAGIVGAVGNGTVKNCYNTAKVSTGDNSCGGVAGLVAGEGGTATLENCYNTGVISSKNICGGVAGAAAAMGSGSTATVKNCYNTGNVVDASTSGGCYVGGVVGTLQAMNAVAAIENCYYLEGTADYGYYLPDYETGDITGKKNEGSAEPKSAAEFASQDTFVNWDFDSIWTMSEPFGRPILQSVPEVAHWHAVCGDTCTHETAHSNTLFTAVSTADELAAAAENGGNYYLAGDIQVTEVNASDTALAHTQTNAVVKVKKDFNLCLNGHTLSIKVSGDARGEGCVAMSVDGTADFTLCDCSDGKTGKLCNDSYAEGEERNLSSFGPEVIYTAGSGDIALYGGTVTNNNHSWVISTSGADGNVIFDGATMKGSNIIGASDGKKVTVKSGIVGEGGATNVITAKDIVIEGGTVNGKWIQVSTSGQATVTGGTVNSCLWVNNNVVVEIGGDATINPIDYYYSIGPSPSGDKFKVYLYGTPNLTKQISCKAGDTADDAPIIPHAKNGGAVYEGNNLIKLYLSGNAEIGKYVVQDMPNTQLEKKFYKNGGGSGLVFRLSGDNKAIQLDKTIKVDTTNFPDDNFRTYVSENYDADKDNSLWVSDLMKITSMNVAGKEISYLKGIEHFTELATLNCSGNHLAALDVSANTKIETLDAGNNVVKINSCKQYALSSLKGMDSTKVSNVKGATLSGTSFTTFDGKGTITYTYNVNNAAIIANPTFTLTYDHTYGDWELTKEPTESSTGEAKRTCSSCNNIESKTDVPNLTDPVWEKGNYVAPQKGTNGSQSYTSLYGEVTVIIPALGYTVADAKEIVEKVLTDYKATNDTTKQDIQNKIDTALSNAKITGVTVTVGDITITEATKEADGKISGTITITKDAETDRVVVDKPIEKLEKTDADKVADAKEVVEKALSDYITTNATTKEDIQSVIDAALTKAGITEVTVTVGDLTKVDATEEAEGSVKGNISLVSRNNASVTDSVAVDKPIAKLPHIHAYTWVITKAATAEETGEMTGTCTCGEVITETIAKTGEGGSGTVVVKEDEKNECKGALSDKADVKEKVALTDTEKEQLSTGEDLVIILRLKDVKVAADTEEKKEIQNKMGANTLGTFLNIELLKKIGGTETPITETTDAIEITFEVPEHIRNTDSKVTRTYQIMRNHDGVVEILDAGSYDEKSHLLTFKTDKFSTYALVYRDTQKASTGAASNQGGAAEEPKGSDESKESKEPKEPVILSVTKKEQEKNALSLNAKLKVSQTSKKINIAWGKVAGADGYDVYVQYCGMKFTKKSITAIKNGRTTNVTVKKVNGKPLNLKKNYKIYVLAYKQVNGKKVTLGKTIIAHIVGKNNTKYTNVKAVRVKKSSYTMKNGKTVTIKASTVLVSKKKKQLSNAHAKQFRYATSDKKVATVSAKGKIKAVRKGSCTIYVYARNGYAKKIKVTVK